MIFSQDRATLRQMYADAWQKHSDAKPLTPLESQIADVIALHPEYHDMVGDAEIDTDFLPDGGKTNPYLHLGLHLGLREQIATNRPAGIAAVFQKLAAQSGDAHDAEHQMIDCLAETLWHAQRQNLPPDESRYLERLQRLIGRRGR